MTAATSRKTSGTPPDKSLGERFNEVADALTIALGSFPALAGSVLLVVVWALTGPLFQFSDTWQLFINTTTTVVTFWMVFVIQNSANRAAKATQLKLDELIRAVAEARNEFIGLDQAPEEVLVEHEHELRELSKADDASAPTGASPIDAGRRRARSPSGRDRSAK